MVGHLNWRELWSLKLKCEDDHDTDRPSRKWNILLTLVNEMCSTHSFKTYSYFEQGPSWLYGNSIYNYPCNQCLSPESYDVEPRSRRGVLVPNLCDKVFSVTCDRSVVSSTIESNRHDITEILSKVALITRTLAQFWIKKELVSHQDIKSTI